MTLDVLERPRLPTAPPGGLETRLAESLAERRAYQRLRYTVFFEEMGGAPGATARLLGLDFDDYDQYADHLLVFDPALGRGPASVVGGYRLIRRAAAARVGTFYSAGEFDLAPLLAFPGEILELGRSCIAAPYRTRRSMQLLWAGIAAYVKLHDIGLMFGCASLPGADPAEHAEALAYLHVHHLAPAAFRPVAKPASAAWPDPAALPADARRAFAKLPPLLKGYLRLGGWIGDGGAIDAAFNTVDVCLVVETRHVTDRYLRHYLRPQ